MKKTPFLGVAYYPEAWPREQIDEDLDKMLEHGISCVRVAEFAWKTMEPTEGHFDFSLFREVVDKCRERGMMVIMGTPGATPPLWLAEKYPDVYGERMNGVKLYHGARQDCCYNHEDYLRLAHRITEKMAEEFGKDDNVIGWQIDNEITANKDDMFCVCEKCVRAYRRFVSDLYDGDVDRYNSEVGTNIFSGAIDSFEQLHRPYQQWTHPAKKALWRRFQLKRATDFVKDEYAAIRRHSDHPIGTDMMPILQSLSYDDMARETDIMQFNNYHMDADFCQVEFWSNMLYNAKKKPYWLTETSCCWNGPVWANYMRHRGFVEANAWTHLASGAESVNYWLWRAHYAGPELMHGSVIESNGRARHIKSEVQKLSADMDHCADLINGTRPVDGGLSMVFSESADLTFEMQNCYPGFNYKSRVISDFFALAHARLRPAVVLESAPLTDETRVLYTPYLISLEHANLSKRILDWVKAGGTWIATVMTDIRTASEAKYVKAATGVLEEAADITIDFTIPAYGPNAADRHTYDIAFADGKTGESLYFVYDAITPGKTAKTLATYVDDEYLNGYSAVTETPCGKGKIIFIGFVPKPETAAAIIKDACAEAGITPFIEATPNLTVVKREGCAEAVIAIDHEYVEGSLVSPFDCVDMLTDTHYAAGDTVPVGKYGVRVLRKE